MSKQKLSLLMRSDSPQAEIYLYKGNEELNKIIWQADRQLAEHIFTKIKELLDENKLSWQDIQAVGCFAGPGSFTGLRITHTVANALAYSLNIPAANASGSKWQKQVLSRLASSEAETNKVITPNYGREARITIPKK